MKERFDYFGMFEAQGQKAQEAVKLLSDVLSAYDETRISAYLEQMHAIELAADTLNHKVKDAARNDFVTPLDRDDIVELAADLDDVVDAIEDIMLTFYMYHLKYVGDEMREMLTALQVATDNLVEALKLFPDYKKKEEEVFQYVIKVNDAESMQDRLYLSSMRRLYDPAEKFEPVTIVACDKVYNAFEDAADTAETCGSRIGQIITTNI